MTYILSLCLPHGTWVYIVVDTHLYSLHLINSIIFFFFFTLNLPLSLY